MSVEKTTLAGARRLEREHARAEAVTALERAIKLLRAACALDAEPGAYTPTERIALAWARDAVRAAERARRRR